MQPNKQLFVNSTPFKQSSIMQKREEFKAQIRKQHLTQLFASKRKQLLKKQINQKQKENYLKHIAYLIQRFLSARSQQQSEQVINQVLKQLNRDNADFQSAIKQYPTELLKMFIMFPKNRYSVQILYQILTYCYDDTFQVDDQKFCLLYNENVYEIQLDKKQKTEYQQSIEVLLRVIDEQIPTLRQRKNIPDNEPGSLQENQLSALSNVDKQAIRNHNLRIERGVKMYLMSLKELILKMNNFLLRFEFAEKYLIKWAHQLLIEHQFGQNYILYYLIFSSRFIVPFKTWVENREFKRQQNKWLLKSTEIKQHKISNTNIKNNSAQSQEKMMGQQNQSQIQDNIMSHLFYLCIPKTNDIQSDKTAFLSMLVIKAIFKYKEIKITKLIQFLDKILGLTRIVLNYQRYYRLHSITGIFQFLTAIVARFCEEMSDQDVPQEDKKLMAQVNLIQILTQMEFISTFDLYLMMENQIFCQPLYALVSQLIEYCIIYNIDLSSFLYQKNIFPQICHTLDTPNTKILLANLKSIELISQYALRQKRKQYFVKMVNYGVDDRLQHLQYHMNQWIQQKSNLLLQTYFTEDQVYDYTELQCQLQRYQGYEEEWR